MRALSVLFLTMFLGIQALAQPDPRTAELIEELQLREGDVPMSRHAQWQPRQVMVGIPRLFLAAMPGIQERLEAVAGDVQVRIEGPGEGGYSSAQLAGVDAFIGFCSAANIATGTDIIWYHSISAGVDGCAGLTDEQLDRVVFSNSKRLHGPAIAEHSIAVMLALARGLPDYQRAQAQSKWDRRAAVKAMGFGEISGKTMLVVGLGGIGTQIAKLAHGLEMRVVATRNSSRSGPAFVEYVGLADELPKLAAQADVVVNALPLTASTTGLFDGAFFSAVKPGAMFISIGRGKSTVTADLIAALDSGHLHSAGLDVTDPEPLPADSPLWKMHNVIITPHVSAQTKESLQRVSDVVVENLRRYVAGEPLLNVVDMRAGY